MISYVQSHLCCQWPHNVLRGNQMIESVLGNIRQLVKNFVENSTTDRRLRKIDEIIS